MKKIIPICILGLFIFGGMGTLAQPTSQATPQTLVVHFSQPTVVNDNTYVSIDLQEANQFLTEQGKPLLPCYTQTLYYPFGTKILGVTVTPSDIATQTLSAVVAPTPAIEVLGMDASAPITTPMNYGTDPYPATWFDYQLGGGIYDNELSVIVTVQIHPIIYHPLDNSIEYARAATITVQYEPGAPRPETRDSYQLVVIGPAMYSSDIAPLITHKNGEGITAKFVSVEDIYSGTYFPVTGRDNQEKIKYFIKNAIENWNTGSILLLGSASQIPTRDTHVYIADDPDYGSEIFTSDLYYADIYNATGAFSSWDTNSDSIFGEFHWNGKTDIVDLHPDVYLARLAAYTNAQVSSSVAKIIGYETTPGYQQDWFNRVVLCGGDSFDDTGAVDEGEYQNQKVADLMTGFIADKEWASNGKLTGIIPSGVTNIKDAINAGCGFVDFSGHGNTNIWASHPHTSFSIWIPTPYPPGGIRNNDILTLTNGAKLPIVTVEACSTSKFAADANCFNWAFVYSANGGAIGSYGATGIGYGYVGDSVTTGLTGKMGLDTYRAYKSDGAVSFGEQWSRALNRYIHSGMDDADYKTVEEWQPFGDPTLIIGEKSDPPAKPATPSGTANGNINTEYSYTSTTTDPNNDKVYFMFDWGDGTTSGWLGPYNSGSSVTGKKTWTTRGNFTIRVVAKDTHGILSVWSDPLPVNMPLDTQYSFHPFLQFFEKLLERFPNAFPILRALILG